MRKILTFTFAVLLSVPALAQSNANPRTTGDDHGNSEHREGTALNDTVAASVAATEKTRYRSERVWSDATRLAGLLRDVQTEVTVTPAMWRTIANEANTLANRIYARTTKTAQARTAARELRTHVREMRAAAIRGDAAAARRHATAAMPSAFRLIDWAG